MDSRELRSRILSTFGEIASTIGYSPLHGKIIAVLLVEGMPMSLQDVAKETGYSASMISLSLDLLEVLGVVRRVKKTGDRKLYIELSGDLIETLKNAIVLKVEKSVTNTLAEFKAARQEMKRLSGPDRERAERTLDVLESNIKRLNSYVGMLAKIRLP
jgi:DNA-binding transcriptional regulator GbsR (MarR family)